MSCTGVVCGMLACLRSAAIFGVEAYAVHVEVDVSFGLPSFTMVGLPDASVRESRDRVRSAIRNSGFEFPNQRITVNLAPADIRKAGASFDLPIALGILAATGSLPRREVTDILLLGELSLDGAIQPTRGVLPIAAAARRQGLDGLLLPTGNAPEASIVEGLRVIPVASLQQAVEALTCPDYAGLTVVSPARSEIAPVADGDLADVKGQLLARRALEIAAGGGHNVLLVGPPGAGKTMLARRLPGILPPLAFEEALETTSIHSVAGLLPPGAALLTHRPFRAPHHTISDAALVGGGSLPRPGEISLAHHGVLFLDEMPEFNRRTLEVLRQPLEERVVRIARAARTALFPSHFILVGAMNPCPCGHQGDERRPCRCTPQQVQRYKDRLSGPLRDRFDLTVELRALSHATLTDVAGEPSEIVRRRVIEARDRQRTRGGTNRLRLNADLHGRLLHRWCRLDPDGLKLVERAMQRFSLSARGYDRLRRVARTIADLSGAPEITAPHVAEALQFRFGD